MKELILGPRNSGKSRYAETKMDRYGSQLGYVGTLPRRYEHLARIKIHQTRRDERWSLIELSQWRPLEHMAFLDLFETSNGVLIDGLSSLMWSHLIIGGWPIRDLQRVQDDILNTLSTTDKSWIIVDCDDPFPKNPDLQWFSNFILNFHEELSQIAENVIKLSLTIA